MTGDAAELFRRVRRGEIITDDAGRRMLERFATAFDQPMRRPGVDCPNCHLRRILSDSITLEECRSIGDTHDRGN